MRTFATYVEWDPATKLYTGVVPGVPGAHAQAANLDELQGDLKEILELCLAQCQERIDELPRFIGLLQIEVTEGQPSPRAEGPSALGLCADIPGFGTEEFMRQKRKDERGK